MKKQKAKATGFPLLPFSFYLFPSRMDVGKVNILIVDDKPVTLLSIEAVLEGLHQNVVRAYSGRDALRAPMKQDFAVIVLAVTMLGMDGYETVALTSQLRISGHV